MGVAVADNVMGPYERCEGNPILHRHAGYVGTGAPCAAAGAWRQVLHGFTTPITAGRRYIRGRHFIAPLEFRCDRSAGGDVWRMEVSEKIIVPMVDKRL